MSAWCVVCLLVPVLQVSAQSGNAVESVVSDRSRGAAAARVVFDRDIVPILSANCYECHGPDAEQRQAGLRLDQRPQPAERLESGRRAIVPGKPQHSELIRRILSHGDDRMPPADSRKQLTSAQQRLLVQWVTEGGVWSRHWALRLPRRPALPQLDNADWPRNAVDMFILDRLQRAGISPAPPADRVTWLRRVHLDLTGLPPTPDQVAAFVNDSRPDAPHHVVDRLLASPLYGQRWGRHWLDVARYGDSNGADENHPYPHAYHYRDYVVEAFNRDLPYDRFVRQQLAGDLLPDAATADPLGTRLAATGFLSLGAKILAEKDPVKKQADIVDEQIQTLSQTLLGLTIGCARCHDHKFDPITARDYYALAGILHSTKLVDVALPSRDADAEGQPVQPLHRERAELNKQLAALAESSGAILREAESFDRGNVSVDRKNYGKGIGIISDPGAQENFAEYDLQIPQAAVYVLQLRYAAQNARPGQLLLNGKIINRRAISRATGGWFPQSQQWFVQGTLTMPAGRNVVRLASQPLMSHIDKLLLVPKSAAGDVDRIIKRIAAIDARLAALNSPKPATVKVMAVADHQPHNVRIHIRGSHLNLGPEVARGFVSVLTSASRDPGQALQITDQQSGRLQLARWLTDPRGLAAGLLSRMIVNRVWLWHFGRGLVETPDDFGTRGARPSHPELLDFLAVQFIREGWSIKALHRKLVLSSTYASAGHDADAAARRVDPSNRLYWCFEPRRLEAEVVRDSILFHAGTLDLALGGPPPKVKTGDPSPADLAANRRVYQQSRRRSLYLPVVRTNVYKFLKLFDFPDASAPVGQRDSTLVPTQALLLMNDTFVADQADRLADSLWNTGDSRTDAHRLTRLYQRLFGRTPNAGERRAAEMFLHKFEALPHRGAAEHRGKRAWSALCQTLFASSEFLNMP